MFYCKPMGKKEKQVLYVEQDTLGVEPLVIFACHIPTRNWTELLTPDRMKRGSALQYNETSA